MSPRKTKSKKPKIRRVGVIVKPNHRLSRDVAGKLFRWLGRRGIEAMADPQTAGLLKRSDGRAREALAAAADLLVVVGGDGTLLSVARSVGSARTPILGVNLGSLGFLTEIPLDQMYTSMALVLKGEYTIDERMRMRVSVHQNGKESHRHDILNDVVVNKSALARILTIDVTIDGSYITTYRADGLILSTPTGSTAYSLSAGGPIMEPSVAGFLLSPICPHTLTNRPLVLPSRSTVEVTVRNTSDDVYVTIDGQVGFPLQSEDKVVAKRAPVPVRLVQAMGKNYFDVLRQRLKWQARMIK
jgi:NAD+ kinase